MVNPTCLISHCGLNLPFSDDGGMKNNSVFTFLGEMCCFSNLVVGAGCAFQL